MNSTLLFLIVCSLSLVMGYQPVFLQKSEAQTFLSRTQRSVDLCTTDEYYCEANKQLCTREYDREHICLVLGTQCPPGMSCYLSVPCFAHWETDCTDINECESNPCQNGATCINGDNMYTCTCPAGFTGVNCEQDIDECASDPCQNGATCHDAVNSYTCGCVPGYTGTHCEQDINECASNPCQNGATCSDEIGQFNCWCVPGYTGAPCDTEHNECESDPCQNGGTCNDAFNMYSCTCVPGYTGLNCEQDIDECASDPCLNDQPCDDQVNAFTCVCGEDFTGTLCETDMCLPGAVDIVFLLDGSKSQCSSTFETQRQYVKNFINQFPIGDFNAQFSVVTYSWEANIHFHLNTYTSNTSLTSAIDNITCVDGPSRVSTALRALSATVFQSFYGARASADKYVIILSDGLFSGLQEMVYEKTVLELTVPGVNIVSVGAGEQVLQYDLITVADNFNKVYPVTLDDALNHVLQATVHPGCPDCYSRTTDLVLLMDASFDVGPKQFYKQIDVIKTLLKEATISTNGVHVAYTRFGAEVQHEFGFLDYLDRISAISAAVTTSRLVQIAGPSNVSQALEYVRLNGFDTSSDARSDSRKLMVLLTPGPITELDRVKQVSTSLKDDGVIIAAVATGEDSDYNSLLDVASDPSLTFLIGAESHNQPTIIRSLIGSLDHVVCEMD